MSIDIREFETMVNDTLVRIVENTNITNTNSGSVIRTIVESILVENDIQYYQLSKIFRAMGIDDAMDDDLDRLVSILGIIRKPATQCVHNLTFDRTDPYTSDVPIEYGNVISTLPDRNGDIVEFMVTQQGAKLPMGELAVEVECTAVVAGSIYIPRNTLTVMNTPIVNIGSVYNEHDVFGGTDKETDNELRQRAKDALIALGRGTLGAIETAVKNVPDVIDCIPIDMARGVGTVDVVTVTSTLPPSLELSDTIAGVVYETKSAGIMAEVIYPTIYELDIEVDTTPYSDNEVVKDAIIGYLNSLRIAETFVINQMERRVLNTITSKGYANTDIITIHPQENIEPYGTQIIRAGTITVNGVVML